MEINDKNPLVGLNTGIQRLEPVKQSQTVQKAGDEHPNPETDRIEFSLRSREILHLDEIIQSTPDIREAKVAQIRSAIETGTYNVKAEKIADQIIRGNLLDEVS